MYEYQATVIKHKDSDTSKLAVDCGFGVTINITVRWAGINAPELATPEGKAALVALTAKLPIGTVCTINTLKDHQEKFGRYLATFTLADGTNVNDWLAKSGYAVPYDGGKR